MSTSRSRCIFEVQRSTFNAQLSTIRWDGLGRLMGRQERARNPMDMRIGTVGRLPEGGVYPAWPAPDRCKLQVEGSAGCRRLRAAKNAQRSTSKMHLEREVLTDPQENRGCSFASHYRIAQFRRPSILKPTPRKIFARICWTISHKQP